MRYLYTVPLGADFIGTVTGHILARDKDWSRVALVFPGKRPALYIRRSLAQRCQSPFFPPPCLSMDEFIDSVVALKDPPLSAASTTDALWLLFRSVKMTGVFNDSPLGGSTFGSFFPWGEQLLRFIDALDMEHITDDRLRSVEENADIGYDVPDRVNELLRKITTVRTLFHKALEKHDRATRGYRYRRAVTIINEARFPPFDTVIFAGFFRLTGTEQAIITGLWKENKAEIIVEGDPDEWPALRELKDLLKTEEKRLVQAAVLGEEQISVHSGFDTHSQALKVRAILDHSPPVKSTAVVLPAPESLFPLLSFGIGHSEPSYNISLRYPFGRTAIFDLVTSVLEAQAGKHEGNLYSTGDYITILLNPFIKNLDLSPDMRTIANTVKRLFAGDEERPGFAGAAVISLDDIETEISGQGASRDTCSNGPASAAVLGTVHTILFRSFEEAHNLFDLAVAVERLMEFLISHTPIRSYALSGPMLESLFTTLTALKESLFCREPFDDLSHDGNTRRLCEFLIRQMGSITLPFDTTPLQSMEILGVLETRNLAFERVIILDLNEGIMPKPKEVDPLVPLGIYGKLGLPAPESNEEISRYYFRRLLRGSKDAHLLYIEAEDRPPSRYIQQVVWDYEKKAGRLSVVPVHRAVFPVNLKSKEGFPGIEKNDAILGLAQKKVYSPSALDDYIRCPVLFFYRHLLRFKEIRPLTDDIDQRHRGVVIHSILNDTFLPFLKKTLDESAFSAVEQSLLAAMSRRFPKKTATGEYYLFEKLTRFKLLSYLRRELREEAKPFVVMAGETSLKTELATGTFSVRLKGRIDRIDHIEDDGEYRITDYKTGGDPQYPAGLVKVLPFSNCRELHNTMKTVQLPVYIHLLSETSRIPVAKINGRLVLLRTNKEEMLFKNLSAGAREEFHHHLMEGISMILADILDPDIPFSPFDDRQCRTCPCRSLCHL